MFRARGSRIAQTLLEIVSRERERKRKEKNLENQKPNEILELTRDSCVTRDAIVIHKNNHKNHKSQIVSNRKYQITKNFFSFAIHNSLVLPETALTVGQEIVDGNDKWMMVSVRFLLLDLLGGQSPLLHRSNSIVSSSLNSPPSGLLLVDQSHTCRLRRPTS